jgi:tRNA ligase
MALAHPSTKLEDTSLVSTLYTLSAHKAKKQRRNLIKATSFIVPQSSSSSDPSNAGGGHSSANSHIEVTSWKFDEFQYSRIPCPFPCMARGLFSTEPGKGKGGRGKGPGGDRTSSDNGVDGEGRPRYRIVIRGYDKFFNVGEVPWTMVCKMLSSSPSLPTPFFIS